MKLPGQLDFKQAKIISADQQFENGGGPICINNSDMNASAPDVSKNDDPQRDLERS